MDNKKEILNITLSNIKGIKELNLDIHVFANRPNFFVAPNGFGKSSIAIGFKSMNSQRMKLSVEDCFEQNEANKPTLSINYNETIYYADENKNEIKNMFDIFVINNQLISKTIKKNMGKFTSATSYIGIEPIQLINKIPKIDKINYLYKTMKTSFGNNGCVLININSLIENDIFIVKIFNEINFKSIMKIKNQQILSSIVTSINKLTGDTKSIRIQANKINLFPLKRIEEVEQIANIVRVFVTDYSLEIDYYLSALQIISIYKNDEKKFKCAALYSNYKIQKKNYSKLLVDFNSSWKNIKVKEQDGSLIVDFPHANCLSNGERDVLVFVLLLEKSKNVMTKDKCLLIIDEVFDYLDDVNLLAFQYYITRFIDSFKQANRELFSILLTHLDVSYFNHFCFNNHRMCINYLDKRTYTSKDNFLEVVKKRKDVSIENEINTYFFHYNPEIKDLEKEFVILKLRKLYYKSDDMHKYARNEVLNYLSGKEYDPLAVCLGVRIEIEKKVYCKLDSAEKEREFLKTHKTKDKLHFAFDHGIEVPEIYYLLGLIYNDSLHYQNEIDFMSPLISKLSNITIKHLIKKVFVEKTSVISCGENT